MLSIPVNVGELFDKISILTIKSQHLSGVQKYNVLSELNLLKDIASHIDIPQYLTVALEYVNKKIWDIENGIRLCEKNQTFNKEFVKLARSVYFNNDKRARIKKDINILVGSLIIEEKVYEEY